MAEYIDYEEQQDTDGQGVKEAFLARTHILENRQREAEKDSEAGYGA
jgi:hypothetical protein